MRDDPEQATSEELVEHGPYLESLATRLTRDPNLAGDLVQDTWLAALRHPPRRSGPVRAWLATVMRHVHFNRVRDEARAVERWRRSDARLEECGADERAGDVELQARLLRALATLDAPQREALVLRFLDGLPPRKIAKRLGVPVETVRTRLKRGAERLRIAMRQPRAERRYGFAGLLALVRRSRALLARPRVLAGALSCAAMLLLAFLFFRSNTRPSHAADPVDLASGSREPTAPRDAVLASIRGTSERTELSSLSARPAPGRGLELELRWAADQRPAAHVQVAMERVVGAHARGPARFAETSELGRIELPDLEPGRWIVTPWLGSGLWIDVQEGRAQRVELELPPGRAVEGVVLLPPKSPAFETCEIWASFPRRPELQLPMGAPEIRGQFRLGLVDPDAWIGARRPDFAPSALLPADVGLELKFGAQVKGKRTLELEIVDHAGSPIHDAQAAWLSDRLSRVDAESGELFQFNDDEPTPCDAHGLVSLPRPNGGLGRVYVRAPGFAPYLGPAPRVSRKRIELQPECTFAGHVVPSDERYGVAGLTVAATSPGLPYPILTTSAADGSFLLKGLPAGAILIEAGIDDGRPGAARLELELGPAEHGSGDLRVSAEGTIQGMLVDCRGSSTAGWTVTLEDPRRPARLLEELIGPRTGLRTTTADREGRFEFEGCAATEYLVCAHPPRALKGPGGHARVSPRGETWYVQVSSRGGARVHGVFVRPDPELFPHPRMLLDSQVLEQVETMKLDPLTGYFEFSCLPEGKYVLATLAPSRGVVRLQEFLLQPDSDLDLGRVVAPLPGKLHVRIDGGSPSQSPEVSVLLMPGGSSGALRPNRQPTRQRLDAEGCFTLEGILPGRYRLVVEKPGSEKLRKDVEVRAGETTEVELP